MSMTPHEIDQLADAIAERLAGRVSDGADEIGDVHDAAIGLMAADDGSLGDASYVLRWLRQRTEAEVSRRDVHVHGRARFDAEPARLDRALDVLVDRGWLRLLGNDRQGPGRPSVRYQCHPSIASGSGKADRAEVPPWEPADCDTGLI